MLDYIKERVALDFNFLINYWWIYVIIILAFIAVLTVTNFNKK